MTVRIGKSAPSSILLNQNPEFTLLQNNQHSNLSNPCPSKPPIERTKDCQNTFTEPFCLSPKTSNLPNRNFVTLSFMPAGSTPSLLLEDEERVGEGFTQSLASKSYNEIIEKSFIEEINNIIFPGTSLTAPIFPNYVYGSRRR